MKNENNTAKIYDLVELYNFTDLSEVDKKWVLKQLSEKEYNDLRSTLQNTKNWFSPPSVAPQKESFYKLERVAKHPIPLYKVAAAILLLMGLNFIFTKNNTNNKPNLLTSVDTVFIQKIDTFFIQITDTIEQIKERVVYRNIAIVSPSNRRQISSLPFSLDCSKNICPADMKRLKTLNNNSFSEDKTLKEFLVLLN